MRLPNCKCLSSMEMARLPEIADVDPSSFFQIDLLELSFFEPSRIPFRMCIPPKIRESPHLKVNCASRRDLLLMGSGDLLWQPLPH